MKFAGKWIEGENILWNEVNQIRPRKTEPTCSLSFVDSQHQIFRNVTMQPGAIIENRNTKKDYSSGGKSKRGNSRIQEIWIIGKILRGGFS